MVAPTPLPTPVEGETPPPTPSACESFHLKGTGDASEGLYRYEGEDLLERPFYVHESGLFKVLAYAQEYYGLRPHTDWFWVVVRKAPSFYQLEAASATKEPSYTCCGGLLWFRYIGEAPSSIAAALPGPATTVQWLASPPQAWNASPWTAYPETSWDQVLSLQCTPPPRPSPGPTATPTFAPSSRPTEKPTPKPSSQPTTSPSSSEPESCTVSSP